MQRARIKQTAHRGNGGRLGENDNAGAVVFYPQYKPKVKLWQPLRRLARRAMMRAGMALTGAGESVATWGQWLGARLGLWLVVAGDRLAATALLWECEQ